jgi:hypothetical protein
VNEFIIYTINIANKNETKECVQNWNKKIKLLKKKQNNVFAVTTFVDLFNICINVLAFQRGMYPLALVAQTANSLMIPRWEILQVIASIPQLSIFDIVDVFINILYAKISSPLMVLTPNI